MRHLGLQSFNQVLSVPFDVFNLFIKFAVVFNPFLLFFQHGFLVGFQNFFLSQAFHFGHRVHKRFSFAQDFGFHSFEDHFVAVVSVVEGTVYSADGCG